MASPKVILQIWAGLGGLGGVKPLLEFTSHCRGHVEHGLKIGC